MTVERHGFFDRDITIKLACCDLWREAATALGVTHPYRLASATPSGAKTLLRRKGVTETLVVETQKRLEIITKNTLVMPDVWLKPSIGSEVHNQMLKTPDIGSSDAPLALIALNCPVDNRLITGDKRFINALEREFPNEWAILSPRLITFEACLLKICATHGFDIVKDRIVAAKDCNRALKLALGANNQANHETFCEALQSFSPISSFHRFSAQPI
jgi:hypothetical protein